MSPANSVDHTTCMAMTDILNRIGDKWTVMVVGILSRRGTLRFNELKRAIDGVSQRMLTLTLRNLERDGLVTRTIYPEIPPRVEYSLTKLGETLIGPMDLLWVWAEENGAAVKAARISYDDRHADAARPTTQRYAGAVG
jgi:DNA-binding HxlR family transcriptional regulator